MISRGLMADSSSQPRPHFSIVPGRKFSSRKSDFATSCFSSSWPSAWRRSSVMAFLLRATTGHHSDLPWAFSRPQSRIGSPWPGGSILITSAPKSPSSCPQNGPASSVPSSMHAQPGERAWLEAGIAGHANRPLVGWTRILTSAGGQARNPVIPDALDRRPADLYARVEPEDERMTTKHHIEIVEVGPRDGLQSEPGVLPDGDQGRVHRRGSIAGGAAARRGHELRQPEESAADGRRRGGAEGTRRAAQASTTSASC